MSTHRHEAVAREYRRLADCYDERWAFYIQATLRETLNRLPADPGSDVLDIACGTGAMLEAVKAAHPGAKLTGVDVSPEMLACARRRLPDGVMFEAAPADDLPFPDGGFDTVITTNSFHFFRAPETALREMHRVLRPGGALVITDWCDDYVSCKVTDRWLRLFNAAHFRCYGSIGLGALLQAAEFEEVALERYKINWLWGLMTATARKPT